MHKTIVHKQGKQRKTEEYNPAKLRESIYNSCLSVHVPDGTAEIIANIVTKKVTAWASSKPDITSQDIRIKASEIFVLQNADAAYIYRNYRNII